MIISLEECYYRILSMPHEYAKATGKEVISVQLKLHNDNYTDIIQFLNSFSKNNNVDMFFSGTHQNPDGLEVIDYYVSTSNRKLKSYYGKSYNNLNLIVSFEPFLEAEKDNRHLQNHIMILQMASKSPILIYNNLKIQMKMNFNYNSDEIIKMEYHSQWEQQITDKRKALHIVILLYYLILFLLLVSIKDIVIKKALKYLGISFVFFLIAYLIIVVFMYGSVLGVVQTILSNMLNLFKTAIIGLIIFILLLFSLKDISNWKALYLIIIINFFIANGFEVCLLNKDQIMVAYRISARLSKMGVYYRINNITDSNARELISELDKYESFYFDWIKNDDKQDVLIVNKNIMKKNILFNNKLKHETEDILLKNGSDSLNMYHLKSKRYHDKICFVNLDLYIPESKVCNPNIIYLIDYRIPLSIENLYLNKNKSIKFYHKIINRIDKSNTGIINDYKLIAQKEILLNIFYILYLFVYIIYFVYSLVIMNQMNLSKKEFLIINLVGFMICFYVFQDFLIFYSMLFIITIILELFLFNRRKL